MSRRRRVLVVFVRAPRYGTVKSRLRKELGSHAAWRAYQEMTRSVLRTVGRSPFWQAALAITPPSATRTRAWPPLARIAQVHGDLGRRMAAALGRHVADASVVVVGSDIPDMTRDHLRRAFDLLDSSDVVFGPAADGGYWFVGARRGLPLPVINRLFDGVRWSTDHALADTLANVRPGLRVAFAETLRDVDTEPDLATWRDQRVRQGSSAR